MASAQMLEEGKKRANTLRRIAMPVALDRLSYRGVSAYNTCCMRTKAKAASVVIAIPPARMIAAPS